MNVLWIEDKPDIGGLLRQCEAKNWHVTVVNNFYDAVQSLASRDTSYVLVMLDIRLPWGEDAPDWIIENYGDAREAGLRLLEGMRGCRDGQKILEGLELASLHERHAETPVIVLSRIEETKDACLELGVIEFFGKADYKWRELLAAMSGYACV